MINFQDVAVVIIIIIVVKVVIVIYFLSLSWLADSVFCNCKSKSEKTFSPYSDVGAIISSEARNNNE